MHMWGVRCMGISACPTTISIDQFNTSVWPISVHVRGCKTPSGYPPMSVVEARPPPPFLDRLNEPWVNLGPPGGLQSIF